MIARRSPVVQLGVRIVTPLALVVATYLFFAGHNRPGGGFAAGLVLGAVISLRVVTGMSRPRGAVTYVSSGGLLVGLVSLAPLLAGNLVLDQVNAKIDIPLLGTVKSGSALVFDAGVVLIVVGLVVALLDGLGAAELADEPPGRVVEESS